MECHFWPGLRPLPTISSILLTILGILWLDRFFWLGNQKIKKRSGEIQLDEYWRRYYRPPDKKPFHLDGVGRSWAYSLVVEIYWDENGHPSWSLWFNFHLVLVYSILSRRSQNKRSISEEAAALPAQGGLHEPPGAPGPGLPGGRGVRPWPATRCAEPPLTRLNDSLCFWLYSCFSYLLINRKKVINVMKKCRPY